MQPADPLPIALILGPKGIGKTIFLNYLIVRIVEKERAAGTLPTLSIAYFHSTSGSAEELIRFTNSGVSISTGPADYFLSDSLDVADGSLGFKLLVEVASEHKSCKKFKDRLIEKHGKRIIMDVWSLDELKAVKKPDWGDDEVKFLYEVFGGRVRSFLGGEIDAVEVNDDIEDTAQWYFGLDVKRSYPQSWNRALQLIRETINDATGKSVDEELAIATSLFWIVNTSSRESGFSSTFLKFIAGRIHQRTEITLWNTLDRFIGESGEGLCFEAMGHMKLTQTDREYSAKILKKGGRKELRKNFFLPKVFLRTIDDIATLQPNTYGLPIFGNFPLVDAIVKPNIMLQFTVSETHGHIEDIAKWKTIRDHLGGSKKNHKLIFVIPAKNFAKFSCIGIPDDLECYYMTWEEVTNESVTKGIKRKREAHT